VNSVPEARALSDLGELVATNKEIKAQADARRRQYQAKLAEVEVKAGRRKNDNRFAIIAAAGAVLLGLGATMGHQAYVAAQPTPSATASVTPSPSAAATNSALVPSPALAENRTWTGSIVINGKRVGIALDGQHAPQAVANFVTLAKKGFFNNTKCHRLVTAGIYVLQCGDPTGTGSGGPGYNWGPIENAPAADLYKSGTLAMARVGGNGSSMGSQFFIVYKDSTIPSDTAGGYSVFGGVTSGLDAITGIAAKGVVGGATDGAPSVNAIIGAVTVK